MVRPVLVATLLVLLASTITLACKESERTTLLKFKQGSSSTDPSVTRRLDSWVGEDCCTWEGVGCDNVTTHIIKLVLKASIDYDNSISGYVSLNPCLLELKYLTYLDLSGNVFDGMEFLEFLGSMSQLQYLNLSHTRNLFGKVPQNFGNLTKLVSLDLGFIFGDMEVDSLEWAFKLKNLQYLDLSWVTMYQALDVLNILQHLPSLSVLNLVSCQLGNPHLSVIKNSTLSSTTKVEHLDLSFNFFSEPVPHFIQNLSYIRFLDLSSNQLAYSIPSWLADKTHLQYLSLSHNLFSGVDRGVMNITTTKVEHLDLSFNFFSGPVPHFIQNLSYIRFLDLSSNQLTYSIPSWLADKTHLQYLSLRDNLFSGVDRGVMNIIGSLCDLTYLDLSYNQLQEDISETDDDFSKCNQYDLQYLNMQNNSLSGHLPTTKYMSSLQKLVLSQNNFSVIPSTFGELFSLELVDLSYNNLSVLRQVSLANLSTLKSLDIRSNSLDLDISPDWLPPFQLESLHMLPCNINNQFPKWILSQPLISDLDLSNTGIFGSLPSDFGNLMPSLWSLRLANNNISGSIPRSMCKLGALKFLDLQQNKLSGEIPNCWEDSQILGLELSSNKLSGHIPESLTKSGSVQLLSLGDNLLEGKLPISLSNCSKLVVLDVGKNNLCGEVPSWNGANFISFQILILRENRFNGIIPAQLCSLDKLQIVDLASNNLTGMIPSCFGHFKGMGFMQPPSEGPTIALPEASEVVPETMAPTPLLPSALEPDEWSATEVTKGEEREYTTLLHLLVNMDLSCNNLVGAMPVQITSLSQIRFLNLSHNYLNGSIPKEMGKMNALESIDLSFNNFTGSVPESISSIDSLGYLNLSFNDLQGRIPTSRHLQTLENPSTYMGNPGLCGDPLPKKCFGDDNAHPPTSLEIGDDEEEEEENKHEKMWFLLVIMLGFASGFWGIIGVLVVKKRWRHAFFGLAEDIADWLYVRVSMKIAQIKRG